MDSPRMNKLFTEKHRKESRSVTDGKPSGHSLCDACGKRQHPTGPFTGGAHCFCAGIVGSSSSIPGELSNPDAEAVSLNITKKTGGEHYDESFL